MYLAAGLCPVVLPAEDLADGLELVETTLGGHIDGKGTRVPCVMRATQRLMSVAMLSRRSGTVHERLSGSAAGLGGRESGGGVLVGCLDGVWTELRGGPFSMPFWPALSRKWNIT